MQRRQNINRTYFTFRRREVLINYSHRLKTSSMTTVQVTNLEKVPFLAFPADIEEGIQEAKTEFYAKDSVKSPPCFQSFYDDL